MADRPYTVLSWAMSLDGYLDDRSAQRLVLSNAADLDRVEAVRASCDAVLVGAGTVLDPAIRHRELKNWIDEAVLPQKSARGRG